MESSFGRVVGALVAPGTTFRSIAERPTWLVAFLVVCLAPLLPAILALPKIDWEGVARAQIEQMDMQVPQEQVERQVEMMERLGPVMTYFSPAFIAIGTLLFALVFWGTFTLVGGEPGFRRSLAVVSHAMLPMVVAALLSVPVIVGAESVTAEQLQSGGYLASNPAALVGSEAGPVLRTLLSKLDVFTIWTLVLLIIGFRWSGKVSPRTATLTVMGLWLLWVVVNVGFSALGAILGGRGAS